MLMFATSAAMAKVENPGAGKPQQEEVLPPPAEEDSQAKACAKDPACRRVAEDLKKVPLPLPWESDRGPSVRPTTWDKFRTDPPK